MWISYGLLIDTPFSQPAAIQSLKWIVRFAGVVADVIGDVWNGCEGLVNSSRLLMAKGESRPHDQDDQQVGRDG